MYHCELGSEGVERGQNHKLKAGVQASGTPRHPHCSIVQGATLRLLLRFGSSVIRLGGGGITNASEDGLTLVKWNDLHSSRIKAWPEAENAMSLFVRRTNKRSTCARANFLWRHTIDPTRPCFVTQDIYIHWFIDQRWIYRHVSRRIQVASHQTRPFERKRLRGVTGEFAAISQSSVRLSGSPRKALSRTSTSFSRMSTRFSQLMTNLLTHALTAEGRWF